MTLWNLLPYKNIDYFMFDIAFKAMGYPEISNKNLLEMF